MRAVVQRVNGATLEVVGEDGVGRAHARIGRGLVVLVGIETGDGAEASAWMARKIVGLRVFPDGEGRMNESLLDLAGTGGGGGVLLVPNFTVAGRARRGRRPDFTRAMAPAEASEAFARLTENVAAEAPGVLVETGVFGAHMHVSLENDGPVTIWLDSEA